LGTGNDLARCLNWGGGIYTVRESGMTALMYDLQRAAVVLLDRWNVAISSPSGGDKGAFREQTPPFSYMYVHCFYVWLCVCV
jgi:diacylglycerol kinase (ATP)